MHAQTKYLSLMYPCIAMAACVTLCLLPTSCSKALFGEDTSFAKGFSEKKFKRITKGLSSEQVLADLGPPLTTGTQSWEEAWLYFPPGPSVQTSVRSGKKSRLVPAKYTRF